MLTTFRCGLCRGHGTVIANGEEEIDCPRCEGRGEIDGPHICGVPIDLVESTVNELGDHIPAPGVGKVARWRHTEAQILAMYGPASLAVHKAYQAEGRSASEPTEGVTGGHTLGPWNWAGVDAGYQDYETGNWEDPPAPALVYAGDDDTTPDEGNTVAWMSMADPEPIQEANARLIAAAPDLLELLKAVRAWCIPGMNWTDGLAQALLADADAAIAKAEGRD